MKLLNKQEFLNSLNESVSKTEELVKTVYDIEEPNKKGQILVKPKDGSSMPFRITTKEDKFIISEGSQERTYLPMTFRKVKEASNMEEVYSYLVKNWNKTAKIDGMNRKPLNESKEDLITIDVDVAIDPEEETDALAAFKEYGIEFEETGDSTADLTGTKENLIKYLTSEYYGLDIRDLKDLWPELFESKLNEGKDLTDKTYSTYILKKLKDSLSEDSGALYSITPRSNGFAVTKKWYVHSDTVFNFKIKDDKFIIKLNKNAVESGNSYTFNDYKNALDFGYDYYIDSRPMYNKDDIAKNVLKLETKLAKKYKAEK